MLFNHKPRLAFIFCITLLASCSGSRPCIEGTPILNYVSFTNAETDSIILRKYIKDAGFNSLVDSVVISKSNSIYQQSNDTLHTLTSAGGDYALDIHFDYEVYMPFANKLFRISDIIVEQTEVNAGISMDKTECLDPIKSYTLNGQKVNTNSYVLYLKN